jgi:hypothetical protein
VGDTDWDYAAGAWFEADGVVVEVEDWFAFEDVEAFFVGVQVTVDFALECGEAEAHVD